MKTPTQKIAELEGYIETMKKEIKGKRLSMESLNIANGNILTAERIVMEYYKLLKP